MTSEELLEKLDGIQSTKCETQTLEIKAASEGCPNRLFDTLSSFSNQDDGGCIIFGVNEANDFYECGVYDPQDLQKKINEQCLQMEPPVRPLLTVAEKDGKFFVAAEIPGIELSDRPCFYKGKGRLKGSYIRVGESDEPMTEYEIYSYEAFRRKSQDDIRAVPRAAFQVLDQTLLADYILKLKEKKPNISSFQDELIYELMSITRNGEVTLSALMLFCRYPQAFFPQLCVTAVSVPGDAIGDLGGSGERFLDNERIEGAIPEMLDKAIAFVRRNMKMKTIIDPETGTREDRAEYPVTAVREAVLNALVHRDYSIHTEGMPIQIRMFRDRIEIHSPGGIYGRLTAAQLGKIQADTRNPSIVTALELLHITENRYSGIPTIRRCMAESKLPEPIFMDDRGTFKVILYNGEAAAENQQKAKATDREEELLLFLRTPRTRAEIAEHLGIGTINYAMQAYVEPLIRKGLVKLTIPEQPRSRKQQFVRS